MTQQAIRRENSAQRPMSEPSIRFARPIRRNETAALFSVQRDQTVAVAPFRCRDERFRAEAADRIRNETRAQILVTLKREIQNEIVRRRVEFGRWFEPENERTFVHADRTFDFRHIAMIEQILLFFVRFVVVVVGEKFRAIRSIRREIEIVQGERAFLLFCEQRFDLIPKSTRSVKIRIDEFQIIQLFQIRSIGHLRQLLTKSL